MAPVSPARSSSRRVSAGASEEFPEKILKFECVGDDTAHVTLVIALQALLAALAGLLLLEHWQLRHKLVPATSVEADAPIEFHPELIVRWDDDADYARPTRCIRPTTTARRQATGSSAVTTRTHAR